MRGLPRGRRPAPGAFVATLMAALLLLLSGGGAALRAQGEVTEGQLEAAFAMASARYDRELSLYQQATFRAEQALAEVTAARSSGDAGRFSEALATFHARAMEEVGQGLTAGRAAVTLREAATALVDFLDAHEVEILDILGPPVPTPETELILLQELRRVSARIREIDELLDRVGGGMEDNLDLRPVIRLQEDPRDTPADLRMKAEILEDQAASYEAIIADLDARIEELTRRAQLARAQSDLVADLQRYDDLTPGGRLMRVPPDVRNAPGAGDALAQLDPEEQLEVVQAMRARAEENRFLAMEQADLFREMAEGSAG